MRLIRIRETIQQQAGTTLIEVLLVMAIMGIIAGLSPPVYFNYIAKDDLQIATTATTQSLRRAQALARHQEGDEQWGVYIQSDSVTVFQGSSYATRNSGFDEVNNYAGVITPSGVSEIVFEKQSGLPDTTGTITLSTNAESNDITINEKGTISY